MLPFFQVDAFASGPFTGNPAAVVLLESETDSTWLQNVAMENNLSETAFVLPQNDGRFSLRWLTPTTEVDLCGHATLAAAHVLWEVNRVARDQPIVFATRSGDLTVRKTAERIQLDFPILPVDDAQIPEGILEAFTWNNKPVEISHCGRSRFDFIIEVAEDTIVRNLTVDFTALARVAARGIIVTARADDDRDYNFVSRFFGPATGVNEDPVTGSAHCALIDYWSRKLRKDTLTGYQASERGGFVHCVKMDDRVILSGKAVTVIQGELVVRS